MVMNKMLCPAYNNLASQPWCDKTEDHYCHTSVQYYVSEAQQRASHITHFLFQESR